MTFVSVNQIGGYIQDLYGGGKKAVQLFASIRVQLKVEKLIY
jgi:hypothetical protein